MPSLYNIFLLSSGSNGRLDPVPASEINLLVGVSGTVNFGFLSQSSGCLGSVIGGGYINRTISNFATVAGGIGNSSSGYAAIVGGGQSNTALCAWSSIGGGFNNRVCSQYSNIDGGDNNVIRAQYAFIGGGQLNTVSVVAGNSVIGGGALNTTEGECSVVVGGCQNASAELSFIGGGRNNCSLYASTIGGGRNNSACAPCSFIGGGFNNSILSSCIGGQGYTSLGGTIGGGVGNRLGSFFVGSNAGDYSVIGGGQNNCAGCIYTSILGGTYHCVFAPYSYVAGGRCSVVSSNHSGAAVLGDGQDRAHLSSGPNTLTLDFASGIYVSGGLYLNGRQLLVSAAGNVFSPTVTAG